MTLNFSKMYFLWLDKEDDIVNIYVSPIYPYVLQCMSIICTRYYESQMTYHTASSSISDAIATTDKCKLTPGIGWLTLSEVERESDIWPCISYIIPLITLGWLYSHDASSGNDTAIE